MSGSLTLATAFRSRLEYIPVGLFGSVMGLTGLSIAWRLAQQHDGLPAWPSLLLTAVATADFALLAAYLTKSLTAPEAVRAEWKHPVAGSLFGTILISLLVLPIVLAPISLVVARVLWIVGASGMVLFAWLMVSRWASDRQQVAQATPAWIVPVVGLLDVPLALPRARPPGPPRIDGVLSRRRPVLRSAAVLDHPVATPLRMPMPEQLKPSLLILVAPFAVGTSFYAVATGSNDLFAEALYALALFILAVLLGQMRHLARCCPFRVSWWAVSFPLAASARAALHFATANPGWFTNTVALGLLSSRP